MVLTHLGVVCGGLPPGGVVFGGLWRRCNRLGANFRELLNPHQPFNLPQHIVTGTTIIPLTACPKMRIPLYEIPDALHTLTFCRLKNRKGQVPREDTV